MDIKFMGYCADDAFASACTTERADPIELESFYSAVNQDAGSGCCCCKQDVRVFAVQVMGLPIKPTVLSLCVECARRLPAELRIINISSVGAPPALVFK